MPTTKTASKVNQDDAREWLASLQQVGEGWYRQVALAVRAGAPKALSMTRREFTEQIGQRLIDPRQAIIELHQDGHNNEQIAAILHVSPDRTVARVLAEEGLIEPPPSVAKLMKTSLPESDGKAKTAETSLPESDQKQKDDDQAVLLAELADLEERVQVEQQRVQFERAKAKQEMDKLRKERDAISHKHVQALKDLKTAQQGSEQDKARLKQEQEAIRAALDAKFVPYLVGEVVAELNNATAALGEAIGHGTLSAAHMKKIDVAYDKFTAELTVAQAATGEETKTP